ncbi:MAG: phosphotransferase [Candidatus Cloacimonetes bacterium]|nr:phosphotransferase [Candidatus Cloacimonadota bacterium]
MSENLENTATIEASSNQVITGSLVVEHLLEVIIVDFLTKWNLDECEITLYPQYEECKNVIYFIQKKDKEYVLRFTFRKDRTIQQLQAEAHFIDYLRVNKVPVAYPIKSKNGTFVETLKMDDLIVYGMLFSKAKGFSMPEKNYQYRKGVPIDEYYHNFGKTIGLIHKLTGHYSPQNRMTMRHELLKSVETELLPKYLPKNQDNIENKFNKLINETKRLPRDAKCFGLIHADFHDGNFLVNNDNGNLILFDFDDSAYCWFMYELANAWTRGMKFAQYETTIERRKAKMDEWFEKIMGGYSTEHTLSNYWLTKLELFIKVVEMEYLINIFQHLEANNGSLETNEELNYRITCIENDIPYFGFFDNIYNPDNPFCLPIAE